jgi:hypothetical protein
MNSNKINEIKVIKLDKPLKVSKDLIEEAKVGLSKKMINNMRKEAIMCIKDNKQKSFIECYLCRYFVRRIKGVVHCKYTES